MKTVVFETLWANPADGWSIAARAYARAMLMAGWDVRLKTPVPFFGELTDEVRRFLPLERPTATWDAYIFSCALGGIDQMAHIFSALSAFKKPRMFYTMFERLDVSESLARSISELDGCFVPSSSNLLTIGEAFRRATTLPPPKTWWRIPLPFFDDDIRLKIPPPSQEPRVFAWHGRWEPRKSPDRLLRAFMRAFHPSEAELILKLGPVPWDKTPFPSPEEIIRSEIEEQPHGWSDANWSESIHIVRGLLTESDMLALEAKTDVYVCPSRGEGIDLPAFRARLAGRRLVVTDCGGPVDFLDRDDILIPRSGLSPAPEYASLWGPNQRLIDYELERLVEALGVARSWTRRRIRNLPEAHRASFVARRLDDWIDSCR